MSFTDSITNDDVGALIPEEVAGSILQNVEVKSAAMQLMRKARMTRAQQRLPVLSALPTAYFVASGGGLKQTSKAAWANKYLVAEEIAVIIPIPEAYLDDAEFDVWGEIKPKIAEAFAVAIDGAVLFGTNKPDTWGLDVYAHAIAAGNAVVRGAVGGRRFATCGTTTASRSLHPGSRIRNRRRFGANRCYTFRTPRGTPSTRRC